MQLARDVVCDFAAILTATSLAGWLRALAGNGATTAQLRVAAEYAILFTLLGHSERLYEPETSSSMRTERLVLAKCVVWSTTIWALVSGLAADLRISPVILFGLLTYAALAAQRAIRRWLDCRRPNSPEIKNVLIVGAGALGQQLADYLYRSPLEKRSVIGFLDDEIVFEKVRGRVADLRRVVETEFIDEIILAGVSREAAQIAIREARRCRIDIKVVPELYGTIDNAAKLDKLGDIPVLTLREERIPPIGFAIKRALDVLGASSGLIIIAPLLALIAAAIRLDSAGPILYAAPRVGYKGRRFKCYKFRTMVADADARKSSLRSRNERQGACFKIENDPRITPTGRFLRRYSLDELPQLWNVLRGEMSLVGPRPHPLDDFSRYRLQDMKRLSAIPGLTGLWQVTARRDPSFERSVMLDREYIDHWSLTGDFKILYKTVAAVLQGSGT
ncbi:MAG TPA: sugar transferase [Terriglobales bacterium]